MSTVLPLQPTLWRTCRVIANRTRLEMFRLLVQEPGLTVSTVAARLKLSLSVTSEYLRALEARGLLMVRRTNRCAEYRPSAGTAEGPGRVLAAALRSSFQQDDASIETLFKAATAFAHPRRLAIFRMLSQSPRTFRELQATVDLSDRALLRHLGKLEARGFIASRAGTYRVLTRRDAFGRELVRLAAE